MTFNGRNALKAAIVLFIAAVVAALYFTPARQYMTREHIGEGVSLMCSRVMYWRAGVK